MKIGIISNLYKPYVRGGAEMLVGRLAESLRDNLHHVFVISTQPFDSVSSYQPKATTVDDVSVYRFYPFNIYYYMNDYRHGILLRLFWHLIDIFNFHSYFTIKRILEQEKPDVVMTHNLMGVGFLIPRLLRKLQIRHIHTIHDVQLYAPSGIIISGSENNFQQKIANFLGYPAVMRRLMGSPNMVISPSYFLLDFYKQKGFFSSSQTRVLRNPIEIHKQVVHSPSPELRLVYLGQVSGPKGALQLIDVVRHIDDESVHLKVIGLGPDLRKAITSAGNSSRIHFYGWRSGQDIFDLLGQSDVLVMPSICYENSPTVIFEALSLGIPVITSNIGGAAEVISEGKNGWTFEAGNWKQLSHIIQSIAKDPGALQAMSEACRASVADITIESYIKEVIKFSGK